MLLNFLLMSVVGGFYPFLGKGSKMNLLKLKILSEDVGIIA